MAIQATAVLPNTPLLVHQSALPVHEGFLQHILCLVVGTDHIAPSIGTDKCSCLIYPTSTIHYQSSQGLKHVASPAKG